MKTTRASSSASLSPRLPSCRVFTFCANSGAGQLQLPIEKAAHALVDKLEPLRIGNVAARIRRALLVKREGGVCRDPEIARGEIGEQRLLAGSAVAMTLVASTLAAEHFIAELLLRRQRRALADESVELRCKRTDVLRAFIRSQ